MLECYSACCLDIIADIFARILSQDEKLKRLVESGGGGEDWKQIASYFTDRSDVQCQHRWQKVLNPELIKGPWTKEVESHG